MFVTVTEREGRTLYVNLDVISHIFVDNDGVTIMSDMSDEAFAVMETPQEIFVQLNRQSLPFGGTSVVTTSTSGIPYTTKELR